MKRIYIIAIIITALYFLSFTIGSVTTYEKEPPRNSWPHIETNPVPSFEPKHDSLEVPLEPMLKVPETSPEVPENGPYQILVAQITAYNTIEAQTDSTPCISASGDDICGRTNVVACPTSIALYTWVSIDGKMYQCLDRTHPRFGNRFDISFDKDIRGALVWGIRTKEVIVYKV